MKFSLLETILLVILVGVVSGGGVYYWIQHSKLPAQDNDDVITNTVPIDSPKKDSNLEVTKEKNFEVKKNVPSAPSVSDETLIKIALAQKHNKTINETSVEINENDGTYAQGLVKFSGEIAGGWWLAAKPSSTWIIVADGNGVVMCDDIAQYNFPTSMVPECYNSSTNQLITR